MKRQILRATSVATCFSLILSIAVLAQGSNNPMSSDTSSTNSEQEVLYEKMLNSIDNFDTVQGTFKLMTPYISNELTVKYKADIENDYSYENVTGASIDLETLGNGEDVIIYNNESKGFFAEKRVIGSDPVADMPAKERQGMIDGEPIWYYRVDSTSFAYAKESVFPQERIFGFLSDFSLWNIQETTEFLGRSCWLVSGQLTGEYSEKLNVSTYQFWVDKETGCLLKYEGFSATSDKTEYLETTDINYNSPLSVTYESTDKYNGYTDYISQEKEILGLK